MEAKNVREMGHEKRAACSKTIKNRLGSTGHVMTGDLSLAKQKMMCPKYIESGKGNKIHGAHSWLLPEILLH